jgi:hypothetical protein
LPLPLWKSGAKLPLPLWKSGAKLPLWKSGAKRSRSAREACLWAGVFFTARDVL